MPHLWPPCRAVVALRRRPARRSHCCCPLPNHRPALAMPLAGAAPGRALGWSTPRLPRCPCCAAQLPSPPCCAALGESRRVASLEPPPRRLTGARRRREPPPPGPPPHSLSPVALPLPLSFFQCEWLCHHVRRRGGEFYSFPETTVKPHHEQYLFRFLYLINQRSCRYFTGSRECR